MAESKDAISIGKQLTEVKLSNIIRDIGLGIARAQLELDQTSMKIAQMMSGAKYETGKIDKNGDPIIAKPNLIHFDGKKYSMIELGFTPTFYQFVDTIIEVKMSISTTESESESESSTKLNAGIGGGWLGIMGGAGITATTVSASFASKYQYSAEGSSLVRTKLVPVPPPPILEERIRKMVDREGNKRANSIT